LILLQLKDLGLERGMVDTGGEMEVIVEDTRGITDVHHRLEEGRGDSGTLSQGIAVEGFHMILTGVTTITRTRTLAGDSAQKPRKLAIPGRVKWMTLCQKLGVSIYLTQEKVFL
jgi:hypothetical protein